MWILVVLFASMLVIGSSQGQNVSSRVVNTTQGPVRGYEDESGGLFVFYSIPYATAPTGPYRFKAPLPAPTWSEPFEAVDSNVVCLQNNLGFEVNMPKIMKEDCLIANVYVPATNQSNLPVLVSVHGGAFQIGFGTMQTPKDIVRTQRVIVVTFNYRLGAHGFLCLSTEDIPGNAGLKDQVALLRWVNANIRNFGGNPNDVTIEGCSAGGGAVDLLRLSRIIDGLFNKVIPGSVANIASVVMQRDPVNNARIFAQELNVTLDDVSSLEEFYKNASNELLTSIPLSLRPDEVILSACIERYVGEEVFLNENPRDIIRNSTHRKYPILYSFTNMEGLFRLPQFYEWQDEMNEHFEEFLHHDLQFKNEEQKQLVINEIKQFYFGNQSVSNDTVLEYVKYHSDNMFIYSMLDSVRLHLENGNDTIYLYEYSFVDENTPVIPHTDGLRGAGHCAQSFAVYDQDESNITPEYKHLKSVMRDIMLNFITTGEPVPAGSGLPAWPPTGANTSPYMSIGRTIELRHQEALPNVTSFWRDIYRRHYRAPIPPPTLTPPAPDSAFEHRINTYLCIISILIILIGKVVS